MAVALAPSRPRGHNAGRSGGTGRPVETDPSNLAVPPRRDRTGVGKLRDTPGACAPPLLAPPHLDAASQERWTTPMNAVPSAAVNPDLLRQTEQLSEAVTRPI